MITYAGVVCRDKEDIAGNIILHKGQVVRCGYHDREGNLVSVSEIDDSDNFSIWAESGGHNPEVSLEDLDADDIGVFHSIKESNRVWSEIDLQMIAENQLKNYIEHCLDLKEDEE